MHQNNEVDHKTKCNKNAVVGVGKLNIPVVDKAQTVTVELMKMEVTTDTLVLMQLK